MNALASYDVAERIGLFLDQYVHLPDGVSPIPRNIPYFKDGFKALIENGIFESVEDIKMACLEQQMQIIPNFLFEGIEQK